MPGSTYGVYTGSLRLGYDFSPNWSVNAYENLFIGDAIRTGGSIYGVYGLSQKDITRSLTSLEVLGQVGIHRLALRPYYSFEVSQNSTRPVAVLSSTTAAMVRTTGLSCRTT